MAAAGPSIDFLATALCEGRFVFDDIRRSIATFTEETHKFRDYGDYGVWPGPNSCTFVQAALDSVPESKAVQPPTAIGKDFPYNGRWIGVTASGGGFYISLAGYAGLTIGWIEGFEIDFFGAVVGFDIRRPALKLPGLGRFGVAAGM